MAAAVLCLGVSAFAEITNRIVAIVDNDIITLYELNERAKELTGYSPEEQQVVNDQGFVENRRNLLNLMINERLTQAKIRALGIDITSNQIDATIEKIKQDYGLTQESLLISLKNEGISYEKYREDLKQDIERSRLITSEVKSKIIITDNQITQYYNDHKEEYIKAKFHLLGIILKAVDRNDEEEMTELLNKAQELLARLRKGEDFGRIAKEYSQGLGADDGGDLGKYESAKLNPEFLKMLFDLNEGDISEVIVSDSGVQIIKLISKEITGIQPIEEVRASIEDIIYKQEVNEKFTSWLEDLRKSAYIEIIF